MIQYSKPLKIPEKGAASVELKPVVARNIAELRRSAGMTQLELAEKLNYSDKAVSKWESGASLPDVGVLLEISKIFGVTVDYILSEEHKIPVKAMVRETMRTRKHVLLALMAIASVWLVATAVFVILNILGVGGNTWLTFIWGAPVSAVVAIVFNSIWGRSGANYVFVSILMWTTLAGVYLTLLEHNLWLIFVLGVPGQVLIGLWAGLRRRVS